VHARTRTLAEGDPGTGLPGDSDDRVALVQELGEARACLLDLDCAPGRDLAPEPEQQRCDLRPLIELVLDPREGAAALPECALLAGAALGVALGDELDRAQLPMHRTRLHLRDDAGERVALHRAAPDAACGKVRSCEDHAVDAFDLDVRRHVYFSVVANGRPPTAAETSAALGREEEEIAGAYRRLHDAHALVLFPDTTDVWMANPFCFAPTPHRVTAGGRVWTGTCAWDALGIPGALHCDGVVESECACCGERLELEAFGGELVSGGDVIVHFVVPARRWWDDIGFT